MTSGIPCTTGVDGDGRDSASPAGVNWIDGDESTVGGSLFRIAATLRCLRELTFAVGLELPGPGRLCDCGVCEVLPCANVNDQQSSPGVMARVQSDQRGAEAFRLAILGTNFQRYLLARACASCLCSTCAGYCPPSLVVVGVRVRDKGSEGGWLRSRSHVYRMCLRSARERGWESIRAFDDAWESHQAAGKPKTHARGDLDLGHVSTSAGPQKQSTYRNRPGHRCTGPPWP